MDINIESYFKILFNTQPYVGIGIESNKMLLYQTRERVQVQFLR